MSEGDGGLREFIDGFGSSGAGFELARPGDVNWLGIARAIGTSFITLIAVGFAAIPKALGDAYERILGGVTEFFTGWTTVTQDAGLSAGDGQATEAVPGLIDVTLGATADLALAVWSFNVEQFGIFAFPVAVLVTLVVLRIVAEGWAAAQEGLL